MTTVSIIEEGIDTTGVVKLFDQHTCVAIQKEPTKKALLTFHPGTNTQHVIQLGMRLRHSPI